MYGTGIAFLNDQSIFFISRYTVHDYNVSTCSISNFRWINFFYFSMHTISCQRMIRKVHVLHHVNMETTAKFLLWNEYTGIKCYKSANETPNDWCLHTLHTGQNEYLLSISVLTNVDSECLQRCSSTYLFNRDFQTHVWSHLFTGIHLCFILCPSIAHPIDTIKQIMGH